MNNIIVSGEVTRLRTAEAGGKLVTNLGVKVTRDMKDGEVWTDGYFDVTVWGRHLMIPEGEQVIVQGSLRSKKHYKQDGDGKDIYMPYIDATFGDVVPVAGAVRPATISGSAPSGVDDDVPF